MNKAVGYIRVSTEEQAREGVSLDNQEEKIRAYTQFQDLELVEVIREAGKSGKNLEREGIKRLIDLCKNRSISHIVVYKLDRLTRSTKDLLMLVEDTFSRYDIEFHSLHEKIDTTTAHGKFFLTLMGAMAQMERDLISERTKDALLYKKSQGHRLGTPYMGIKVVNGEVQNIEEELFVLKKIEEFRKSGYTLAKIAETLNYEGIKTKRGGKWYPSTVEYLLKNIIPKVA